jgi:hypothetical protein
VFSYQPLAWQSLKPPPPKQSTSLPAAEELDDSPVKKLAVAAEPALPKSVAAPVLAADWANAACGMIATTTPATANTAADTAASIVILLFIVIKPENKIIYHLCSSLCNTRFIFFY